MRQPGLGRLHRRRGLGDGLIGGPSPGLTQPGPGRFDPRLGLGDGLIRGAGSDLSQPGLGAGQRSLGLRHARFGLGHRHVLIDAVQADQGLSSLHPVSLRGQHLDYLATHLEGQISLKGGHHETLRRHHIGQSCHGAQIDLRLWRRLRGQHLLPNKETASSQDGKHDEDNDESSHWVSSFAQNFIKASNL